MMVGCAVAYVFISIPRSASSSVHKLLGLGGPKNLSLPADGGLLDNHAPSEMLLRRYGPEELARRFKFCFVRNPWDRCVSWHSYHAEQEPYRRYGFRDWIKAGMPHHWEIQNGTVYQRRRTPLEQFRFITDDRKQLMVDFVGKVEQFDQDMATVGRTLGLSLPAKLPRINASKARGSTDYRAHYDDRTAEFVGQMLATDVEMFDYRF